MPEQRSRRSPSLTIPRKQLREATRAKLKFIMNFFLKIYSHQVPAMKSPCIQLTMIGVMLVVPELSQRMKERIVKKKLTTVANQVQSFFSHRFMNLIRVRSYSRPLICFLHIGEAAPEDVGEADNRAPGDNAGSNRQFLGRAIFSVFLC